MARRSDILGRLVQLVADLLVGIPARALPGKSGKSPSEAPAPAKPTPSRSRSSGRSAGKPRRTAGGSKTGSSKRQRSGSRSSGRPAASTARGSEIGEVLRREVGNWRGVPYRLGGTDRSGVDCSGFMRAVFRRRFDLELPRTTSQQARKGKKVSREDLRPGDLVFFRISDRTRHVGAYVGDGEFLHASSSRGVTVSRLGSDYWRRRYWTSRRLL